jgi:hypothetical protein
MAWCVTAWCVKVWCGKARWRLAVAVRRVGRGVAWRGEPWRSWHGTVDLGVARSGVVRLGGQGVAWSGKDRLGKSWRSR